MTDTVPPTSTPLIVIVGHGPVKLWGLTGEERLRRLMRRAGVPDAAVLGGDVAALPALPDGDRVVLLRADHVFEEPLIAHVLRAERMALLPSDGGGGRPAAVSVPRELAEAAFASLRDDGDLPAGVTAVTPTELAGSYNTQLRKRAEFYVLPVTEATRGPVEKRMFAGSYKGVTDIVTKYVFPWPSRHLTSVAAKLGLKPNHVTFIGLLCTLATVWLWWNAHYALGFVCAWAMLVLDTVDGKLARTTLTSSKFGDVFDHSIDLVHPPFWYWAYIHGLGAAFPAPTEMLGVLVAGYIAQRLQEGFFIKRFGIEMHVWRPFDSHFRTITARRDPNVAVLTIAWAVGAPAAGMQFVVAWTVICLAVHTWQIVQAGAVKARGGDISSWLAAPG